MTTIDISFQGEEKEQIKEKKEKHFYGIRNSFFPTSRNGIVQFF